MKRLKNETFRSARASLGKTQRVMAGEIGLSESFIRHVENGRQLPSLPVAIRMSKYLGKPVEALFGDAQ